MSHTTSKYQSISYSLLAFTKGLFHAFIYLIIRLTGLVNLEKPLNTFCLLPMNRKDISWIRIASATLWAVGLAYIVGGFFDRGGWNAFISGKFLWYLQSAPHILILILWIFIGGVALKWRFLSSNAKKLVLAIFVLGTIILLGGLFLWKSNVPSPDTIRASDYMGGCVPERYINGDCMFDSVKRVHANFYPLITEGDGIWEKLDGYSEDELKKIATQELEKLKSTQYKGQKEQIARVQSFIDILSKR